MKKWQITCLISAILIAGLAFEILTIRRQHRQFVNDSLRSIGSDLITSAYSPRLLRVSPDLHARLSELRSARTRVGDVLFGDEMTPTGQGTAWCRLLLTNDAGKGLLLRLDLADKSGRFRVLGYRLISEHDE
jgi:hypothetical protein